MAKTDGTDITDAELESFFAAARADAPEPSGRLVERIVADAAREMSDARTPPAVPRSGWAARLLSGIGGWPAVAGLATAAVAGVWIGVAVPEAAANLGIMPASDGYELDELMPSYAALLEEG